MKIILVSVILSVLCSLVKGEEIRKIPTDLIEVSIVSKKKEVVIELKNISLYDIEILPGKNSIFQTLFYNDKKNRIHYGSIPIKKGANFSFQTVLLKANTKKAFVLKRGQWINQIAQADFIDEFLKEHEDSVSYKGTFGVSWTEKNGMFKSQIFYVEL